MQPESVDRYWRDDVLLHNDDGKTEENWLAVNREEMTAQLTKLREDRLREEVANLQEKSNCRQLIEQTLTNATTVAEETIRLNLRDLGFLGEIRLSCFKSHQQLSHQIVHHMDRVTRAKKLAESARTIHRELVAERLAAEETLRERDTEQFLAWQRSRKG